LARATSWMRSLRQGEFVDTNEIAQRFGLGDAHVRRLLRVAYLAPDIVEAIIEGRQPRTLTGKRLLRGIPLSWADQRDTFGLRGRSRLQFPVTLRSRGSSLRPNPNCEGAYGS